MAIQTRNLTIYRGADFEFSFREENSDGTYVDYTGAKVLIQFRAKYGDETPLLSFSAQDGNMEILDVLDPTTGTTKKAKVRIWLTPEQTEALAFNRCFYDVLVEYTPGVDHDYILKGAVVIEDTITKDTTL